MHELPMSEIEPLRQAPDRISRRPILNIWARLELRVARHGDNVAYREPYAGQNRQLRALRHIEDVFTAEWVRQFEEELCRLRSST